MLPKTRELRYTESALFRWYVTHMITLTDIHKHYGQHHVLKGIDLNIHEGEVFGIIGKSGAGKSTLLRCLNLLERPDRGTVFINNASLTTLTPEALRHARHHIGMIFQHFNLLHAKTVYDNIALPLRIQKIPESDIKIRVLELLSLVELSDKIHVKPDDLSGGQKQRVAIARALSSSPHVLLCDEATSALDPETTTSILNLLKKINALYRITIVLITHEMDVIKQLAHRVALMEHGKIVDLIALDDLFIQPSSPVKQLLCAHLSPELPDCLLEHVTQVTSDRPLLRLFFKGDAVKGPMISQMSRELHLDINILLANVERLNHVTCGVLIVEIHAHNNNLNIFFERCKALNITAEILGYVTDHAL